MKTNATGGDAKARPRPRAWTPTPAERRRRRKIEEILQLARKACRRAMEEQIVNDADFEEMEFALNKYIR